MKHRVFHSNLSYQACQPPPLIFVPCLNEVEEGGYCTTLSTLESAFQFSVPQTMVFITHIAQPKPPRDGGPLELRVRIFYIVNLYFLYLLLSAKQGDITFGNVCLSQRQIQKILTGGEAQSHQRHSAVTVSYGEQEVRQRWGVLIHTLILPEH